jgi:hypothetical protein
MATSEDAEDKAEAEIGESESGERTEERGARGVAAKPVCTKCSGGLDEAAQQAGEDARLPGELAGVGARVDGAHDEEDIGKDGGRVDAERNGGDVVAAGACGETAGLPRIEEIADEDGDSDAWQDAGGDEVRREAADGRKTDDEKKVRKSGEEEAEETIDVSRGEPGKLPWAGHGHGLRGLAHAVP